MTSGLMISRITHSDRRHITTHSDAVRASLSMVGDITDAPARGRTPLQNSEDLEMDSVSRSISLTLFLFTVLLSGCATPNPGPDKAIGGAILGAGWGAGAGAVVGNQVGSPAGGAAVGAGLGAGAGMLEGMGYDIAEGELLQQERQLASLKIQNLTNTRQLEQLQGKLDRALMSDFTGGVYQVFFDGEASNMRAGTLANLEVLAESIKSSPHAARVVIVGHSDDAGTSEYNDRLAEARARAVSAYLGSRGVSMGQITVRSFGSKRPLVSNSTPEGRQLNRRVDVYITTQRVDANS